MGRAGASRADPRNRAGRRRDVTLEPPPVRLAAVTDWAAWHTPYDDPDSSLSQRLRAVRAEVASGLDRAGEGPVRLLSLCAGRGLDVLPLLPVHARGPDVRGRLVELDARNVEVARSLAPDGIEVVQADAGSTDAYVDAAPADLLLLCGIFGNISNDDVERTARAVPQLCAPGATVVWTRSRHAPDLTPAVRKWFADAGVVETAFVTEGPGGWAVCAGIFHGQPEPLVAGRQLFTFTTRPPA
jgi:hypothetical protein